MPYPRERRVPALRAERGAPAALLARLAAEGGSFTTTTG